MSLVGRTLSHYRILEPLGSGGMGEVYRARDERLERDVAVKVLPAGALADESARRQFRKEALALSKLNHPNIAVVHDFDSQEGVDFLVMELVSGETLSERVRRGPLAEKEVARLGEQLAEGLSVAHRTGVLHRDVKPGNLRVTPEGLLKILDFGLARVVRVEGGAPAAATETVSGGVSGTVPYMAPEQLRGERLDERTDLWSVGATLYELSTGQRSFDQEPPPKLIDAILHETPVQPREAGARISTELQRIILKCLEKDREDRYQSARELAVDLRHVAAPVGPRVRASRSRGARRAMLVGGLSFAAVMAAVVALLAFNVGGFRERLLGGGGSADSTPSLAVLPLANLSGDPGQEFFADGMTDELITRLAQVPALKVISRSSSMLYKETRKPVARIARELGVKMLVQGTVQRAGEQIQIRAQLVEAATDRNLWADSFQRGAGDVFAIQAEVARAVVDRIRIKLTPKDWARLERTEVVSPEAHDFYLRGRYELNRLSGEEYGKAAEFFRQATQLKPDYAEAWAGLAGAYYAMSSVFVEPSQAMPKARAAAMRALEIDPDLAEAHAWLGTVLTHYDRNWAKALVEFQRAVQLAPSSFEAHFNYAGYLQCMGQLEQAQDEYDRACELNPLSTYGTNVSIWCRYLRGRYDEAIARQNDLLRMAPGDAQIWYNLGQCYLQKGETSRAIELLQRADSLADGAWALGMLGQAYAMAGRTDKARYTLDRMKQAAAKSHMSPYNFAIVYAGMGDRDRCFEWLEKAYTGHDEMLHGILVDPALKAVRNDPRYTELVRRLGLG